MKIVPIWLTQNDTLVRDSHAEVNRQPPNQNGVWALEGGDVKYPADSAAGPEEACNCRCVLVPTRVGRI